MVKRLLVLSAVAGLSFAAVAQAALIMGDAADVYIQSTSDGTLTLGGQGAGADLQVGRGGPLVTSAAVIPFALPTRAPGFKVSAATFSILEGLSPVTVTTATDLYGLGFRTSATVVTSDFYMGTAADVKDATDATLIKAAFSTAGGYYAASAVLSDASASLVSYLNAQYDAGAVAGNFVFLRVNPQVFTTANRLALSCSESTLNSGANRPTLDITFASVPEPTSLALLGLSAVALLRRRRA